MRDGSMRRASCRLVFSWAVWSATFLFALVLLWCVHWTISYHSYVRAELLQQSVVNYAIEHWSRSCPPSTVASKEAWYRNCSLWIDTCSELNFTQTMELRGMSLEVRSLELALRGVAASQELALDATGACDGVESVSRMFCWAQWILLRRDSVFFASLLLTALALWSVGFLCGPWRACQSFHTEWDKRETGECSELRQLAAHGLAEGENGGELNLGTAAASWPPKSTPTHARASPSLSSTFSTDHPPSPSSSHPLHSHSPVTHAQSIWTSHRSPSLGEGLTKRRAVGA